MEKKSKKTVEFYSYELSQEELDRAIDQTISKAIKHYDMSAEVKDDG